MRSAAPKITVIVAVLNGAQTLPRLMDSFTSQTYPFKEMIVLDGGSTDGSVEILHRRSEEIVYWETEPDRGLYHAWNKGLQRATGEWLCFLGADDRFWQEDVLERLVERLQAVPTEARV